MSDKKARLLRVLCTLAMTSLIPSSIAAEEERPVIILQVQGTIDPAVTRTVTRGLEQARDRQASAVLIELDTPGGLEGSTRRIVQAILNSPVPVIVYIAPDGARTGSAGAFIALAAHVLGRAPNARLDEPLEGKLTSEAMATLHSILEVRARDTGIVDFVAADREDLLRQAEGHLVRTVFGVSTLSFEDQPRVEIQPSTLEWLLHRLARPRLAYLLLLLGIYGLIYALARPGAVFPGVLGALFLILALGGLETLAVHWAGVVLILLSWILFFADIRSPRRGIWMIGGLWAFVLGSSILFPGPRIEALCLSWTVVAAAAGVTAGFFLGIVKLGVKWRS